MSNLATMEREIYEDLHSLASTTKIRHRILWAIRFHREKQYFFSERNFKFTLTDGRAEYRPGDGYGLPADLVEIIGSILWWSPGGDPDYKEPVRRVGRDTWEWDVAVEAGYRGEPELWNWFDNALRLSPTPNDSTDVLEGPYVRDLGVPVKKYNTSTSSWEFYTPDGNATLSGDFGEGNHWFDQLGGYHLIKCKATERCFRQILQDTPSADEYLTMWLEEKARLEDETEGKTGPDQIEPQFF